MDQDAKENSCDDCSNNIRNSEEKLDMEESKECSCTSLVLNSCEKNELLNLNCFSCEQNHRSPERKSSHCQVERNCENDEWIDDCKCDNERDDRGDNKRTLTICKCCNR